MGKGKLDRPMSNRARRRRKKRIENLRNNPNLTIGMKIQQEYEEETRWAIKPKETRLTWPTFIVCCGLFALLILLLTIGK